MKKSKIRKNLSLNKTTVSRLDNIFTGTVIAGGTTLPPRCMDSLDISLCVCTGFQGGTCECTLEECTVSDIPPCIPPE